MLGTSPRFTLRCIEDDLNVVVPPLPACLDDFSHSLMDAAARVTSAPDSARRVSAIDDQVLWKVKSNDRWRGAGWCQDDVGVFWLLCAGIREEGSREDFYDELERECKARRSKLNAAGESLEPGKSTWSKHLLPVERDLDRLRADEAQRELAAARASIGALVADARNRVGEVVPVRALGANIEAMVLRNDIDELYLAIQVVGSADLNVHAVVLDLAVPGLEADDWEPMSNFPGRPLKPNEVVWLTLLDVPALA